MKTNYMNKGKTYKVPIEIEITDYDIECLLVDSFGKRNTVGYWLGICDETYQNSDSKKMTIPEYIFELLINGKEIKFYPIDGTDKDKNWILTIDKLLNGIALNYKIRPYDSDFTGDSETMADYIIQYALFEEILFD